MVEWTDSSRATPSRTIFSKNGLRPLDTILKDLYNAAAINGKPHGCRHGGPVVLHGLDKAVKNMDTTSRRTTLSSRVLVKFFLLADCLTIVVASRLGTGFTADVQAAFQKFLAVVGAALRKQYH
uniref:Globin domain-containing protein n=1 Tax=Astyanax mexicanus TaxID=7994 RepID=A0A3B1K6J2_ASTMX